jgi:penicillin-binding protein 2
VSVIHAPSRPEIDARMLLFPTATVLLLSLLFLRLWFFQVVEADDLREKGEMYQRTSVSKLAPRGLIFDRKGIPLAGSRPELVMMAVPALVRKDPWVLEKAARMLEVDKKVLEDKVAAGNWKPYMQTPIFIGVPPNIATRIAEAGDDMPGLSVETQPMRYYQDTTSFTHVLGYAWVPNKEDVDRLTEEGIKPAPYVGKLGLEYIYERNLMGLPGQEVMEVDNKRRPIRIVERDNPIPGDQLVLGIDARVQKAAIEALAGRKGGAVAVDPTTGEVLCMVSSPSYDLGLFEGGITNKEYASLQTEDIPQLNRAIYSSYQPGSTFKIITVTAAMRAGKFNPDERIHCPGYYSMGRRRTKCLGRHGAISFRSAMARSCNTYFCTLGVRAGEDILRQTALDYGLGQKSGIDLLGEDDAIIPTDEWIGKWRNPPVWYSGDTVNMAIGQGETLTTALQMANVAAMVANNGVVYKPHVVRAITSARTQEVSYVKPEVLHRIDAPAEFWATLRGGLEAVVEEGTARSGRIEGLPFAGKTGSAEHRRGQKTHGWFVAYAPADKPRIAVAVVVEAAGHGGVVALPVANAMIRAYFSKALPSAPAKAETKASTRTASGSRPASR